MIFYHVLCFYFFLYICLDFFSNWCLNISWIGPISSRGSRRLVGLAPLLQGIKEVGWISPTSSAVDPEGWLDWSHLL